METAPMFVMPLHWATFVLGIVVGWVTLFIAASLLKRAKGGDE